MAAIGTAVLGKSFGRSSVEKAFRPLIDRVEDFVMYTLIIIREVVKTNGIFRSQKNVIFKTSRNTNIFWDERRNIPLIFPPSPF